jgi:RND family efflux transporter MFP subunit
MKRRIYIVFPVAVLLALIGYRLVAKRIQYQAETRQRAARLHAPAPVTVAPVRRQDVASTFEAVGSVTAPLSVQMSAQVSGRVEVLQVHEGDRIHKGQVLVRIDPSEVQAQVRQAQGAVTEAQHRLAQAQMTENPTDVSAVTQLQQEQAAVTSAQTDYDQADQDYRRQVASAQEVLADRQAVVRSAQANLENAKAHYQRQLELLQKGFVAVQDADDARTAVGVQQANLDAAIADRDSAQAQLDIVKTTGKAAIDDAKAKLDQARAALKFAQANLAQQPAYKQNLAALRAAVLEANENLKAAQARLTYTVLAAPFDGFVTGRFMDPGATATPGQPILDVQYMRQVWVTVAVTADVARQTPLGRPAHITFDALPDRVFSGKIFQFNPSADPQSRDFTVRVVLDNPDLTIKPGMFAHVVIDTRTLPGAVVVPREAVQHDQRGDYVFVVDKSKIARRRAVKLGPADVDVIAISQGVQPGELVVTLSAVGLKDGQPVTFAAQPGAAPAATGHGSTMGY